MHEARKVVTAATPTHRELRERLAVVFVVSVGVDLVCSVIAWAAEHGAQGTDIHSYGTAIFWTTTQLLTVSSQMSNPLTSTGRILDVFMEIYAITAVTGLAGTFGAFFHRRSRERRSSEAVQVLSSPR
jgi:ABC-type antimicrobial peptide transport system permease subunit